MEEEEEFIDIHKKEKQYQTKLIKIEKDTKLSNKNKKLILRYLKESELGKTIKKGQKKKIGAGRNIQVAGWLIQMSNKWFKKELDAVNIKDMEKFILGLDQGKIKCATGKAYSSDGKSNIKKFIRKFYKWLLTDSKNYPDLVDWIDTSKIESVVEAIPGGFNSVWKIVELIPDVRRKALIWATFDSGFRQGEILNCRIRDVEMNEDGIYYITCRHSKTKPRCVSLPHSSELLHRWLQEHPDKDNPKSQLWQTSRIMMYKTTKIYGRKALKQNVTVHQLRHTSATHWATKLDRVSFCKKFGWSYNSPSPDRYIDFAKIPQDKINEIVKNEEYTKLSKEMEDQKIQNLQLKEQIKTYEEKQKSVVDTLLQMQKTIGEMNKLNTEGNQVMDKIFSKNRKS